MTRRDMSHAAAWRRLDEVLATLRPPVRQTRPTPPPPRAPVDRPDLSPVVPRPASLG